jgi:hypothetical protein
MGRDAKQGEVGLVIAPETLTRLGQIAKKLYGEGIVIAPLQLAGLLLEQATGQLDERGAEKLAREHVSHRKIA